MLGYNHFKSLTSETFVDITGTFNTSDSKTVVGNPSNSLDNTNTSPSKKYGYGFFWLSINLITLFNFYYLFYYLPFLLFYTVL